MALLGSLGSRVAILPRESSGAPVVVERCRIRGVHHDVLCVFGGGTGVFRSHAASGFPTLEVIGQTGGQVHIYLCLSIQNSAIISLTVCAV